MRRPLSCFSSFNGNKSPFQLPYEAGANGVKDPCFYPETQQVELILQLSHLLVSHALLKVVPALSAFFKVLPMN